MCRKLAGNDVKSLPCRKSDRKEYLPRVPRDGGRDLIWLSDRFKVLREVRFSPKQWGTSNSLLLETESSSRSLRLPI